MISAVRRWLAGTSNRTFVLYPVCVIAFELLLHRAIHDTWHGFRVAPWGAVLLVWGYLQYRLVGRYRLRLGGGGPGMSIAPERILVHGPYGFVRNPMYLGHLIFLLGLALTLRSWAACVLLLFQAAWFQRRVRKDEAQLLARFGDHYRAYLATVKRWIPGVL